MKLWLAKFRISSALDDRRPGPKPSPHDPARFVELRRFERDAAAVDTTLRSAKAPSPEMPAALHQSIMRAVRKTPQPVHAPYFYEIGFRLAAAGLAAVVLAGLWWRLNRETGLTDRGAPPAASVVSATTLELSREVTAMPSALVSPLSDELEKLSRDLSRTADFVLASLP